jgi:hypothetical protein
MHANPRARRSERIVGLINGDCNGPPARGQEFSTPAASAATAATAATSATAATAASGVRTLQSATSFRTPGQVAERLKAPVC